MVADAGGAVRKRFDYMPFGVEIKLGSGFASSNGRSAEHESGTPVTLQFTGAYRDGAPGEVPVDFMGARSLQRGQGRWTSADAPFADQHPADPQSWNLYSYVRHNPLVSFDPTGRSCITTTNINKDGTTITSSGDDGDHLGCEKAGVKPSANWVDLEQDGRDIEAGVTNVDSNSAPVAGSGEERRQIERDMKYLFDPMERLKHAKLPPKGPRFEAPRQDMPRYNTIPKAACYGAPGFFLDDPQLFFGSKRTPSDPLAGNGPGPYWQPNGKTKNGGQGPVGSVSGGIGTSGVAEIANWASNISSCLAARGQ